MNNNDTWGIIYCPKHNNSKGEKRWRRIEKCLNDRQVKYDFVQSENTSGVERLVRMMINNEYRTIIIIGGDSALNDAANCLMQLERVERDKISLGMIPNGLINDFAHFWNLHESALERCIDALIKRRIKRIDVGRVRYKNKQGEDSRRYFLNCVNIGLVAAMMNIRRKTHRFWGAKTLSFLPGLVMMIFQRKCYQMRMKINSDNIDSSVMTVCVGNASGYGQTPNAVPYNGMLDISIVRHSEIMQMIEGLYLFIRGKFLNYKRVEPFRTQKVTVIDAKNAPIAIDGRLIDTPKGTYTIDVEQEVMNLIIP